MGSLLAKKMTNPSLSQRKNAESFASLLIRLMDPVTSTATSALVRSLQFTRRKKAVKEARRTYYALVRTASARDMLHTVQLLNLFSHLRTQMSTVSASILQLVSSFIPAKR